MNKEKIVQLKQAILHTPDDPELHYDLGAEYLALQDARNALICYQQANILSPHHPQILLQLGNTYTALGQHQNAMQQFQYAIEADHLLFAAHYNLGNSYRSLGQSKEAFFCYTNALKIKPNDADVYNNLGNVQRELGQLDQAIASYETALKFNPLLYHAKVHLVHQKQHTCDWQHLETDIAQIRHWVKSEPQAQISPFAFLAMPSTTAAEQKQCAVNWVKNRYQHTINVTKKLGLKHIPRVKNKLHIGYLSADFRLHPLAFLITELIELHDKNKIETFAYSYGTNDNSPERKRFETAFQQFRDIRNLSDIEAAKTIHADNIDILIDLTGFTQSSRTAIAALRPAPIQISWLGFPGTMGAPFFDYLLSDHFITPPEVAAYYTEKLLYLPCYQPNDRKRPTSKNLNRAEHGLPEQGFIFCCFNQSFKITPDIFSIWMRLLQQTPDSILWLLESNPWAKANLLREAKIRHVNPARIIFAPRVSIEKHLARHALADLFLDTTPYNAHTTTSDALWMGLPVLSYIGETFCARVAASLLHSAGLDELITSTLDEYEAKALLYAHQPETLKKIKHQINTHVQNSYLFDTTKMARDLEHIFYATWLDYLKQHDTPSLC